MQRTCTHSPLRRWLVSFLFCEREKIRNLEEKLCTLSECIFRIYVYRQIKLYQWKLDGFKSTDKSDCMLPSSCQNKHKDQVSKRGIWCHYSHQNSFSATWQLRKWLNFTGRMPQHSSTSTSLLLNFVGGAGKGFQQVLSQNGEMEEYIRTWRIWCLLNPCLHVNCLFVIDPLQADSTKYRVTHA